MGSLKGGDVGDNLKERIRIRPMTAADLPLVQSHLCQHFSRDEFTLGLFPTDDELTSDLAWILAKLVEDDLCYLAKDKDTLEIVGVMCSYIQPLNVEKLPFDRLQSQAMRVNFGLNIVAVRNSGFWEVMGESEYVHIFALSVHPNFRRHGLGTRLAREAFFSKRVRPIPTKAASMFTSSHSRRIAERMGFQVLPDSEVLYSTLTWHGKPVFNSQELKDKIGNQSCELLWADLKKIDSQIV